jgi:single-strand DNA-binding protein
MAINIFTASGNVGSDMEVRTTQNGKHVGTFSLPVKSGWGENEKVSWVSCKMFGERAQKLAQHITKGTKLTITGSFVLDEWEKDGVKHSRPCILVNDFDFGGSAQSQQQNQGGYNQQRAQQSQPQAQAPQGGYDFDDTIPFAPVGLQYRGILNAM